MATPCYVRVCNGNTNESYDVGPFDYSGNDSAFHTPSAMNWIYKQIGIIQTKNPESPLIKHKWSYVKDDFFGPKADVKVEVNNITFEIFTLVQPDIHNVVEEHTTNDYPNWVINENESSDSNM